jgi:hypothetical protein
MKLLLLLLSFFASAQNFLNLASPSIGQRVSLPYDFTSKINNKWQTLEYLKALTLNYSPAYINNNSVLGAWVEPSLMLAPINNGNWITSDDATCGNKTSGYSVFRLELNLTSDSNIKRF